MGFVKKAVAIAALTSVIGGGAYEGFELLINDRAPLILEPADSLPPETPLGSSGTETLICPANLPCDTANALGRITTGNWIIAPAIAQTIKDATVAAEDQNFYDHDGMDGEAFARAGIRNICAKVPKCPSSWRPNKTEGGSTITQTDVSWRFNGLDRSPSYAEKIKEIRIALLLEKSLPGTKAQVKDEILTDLLNRMYYGRGSYGIESAAQSYFGVSAQSLTIEQAAMLAGIPKSPSSMDLTADPTSATYDKELTRLANRYVYVVKQLKSAGYIDSTKMHEMLKQSVDHKGDLDIQPIKDFIHTNVLPYNPPRTRFFDTAESFMARPFTEEALAESARLIGKTVADLSAGYQIITTLDTGEQTAMRDAIASEADNSKGVITAAVTIHKDGAISAEVGSTAGATSSFNIITQARREAGSMFKGLAWATALDLGWTLDKQFIVGQPEVTDPVIQNINGVNTVVIGPSIVFPKADAGKDWVVDTGNGCHYIQGADPHTCTMSLEDALAGSSNYVAAYLEQYFGLEAVANSMRAFGVDIKPPYNPSLIIGSGGTTPISIATAYNGLLANQGRATASYSVSRITDPTGAIVYDRALTPPAPGKQVVSSEAATETAKAMERVIEIGTAKGAINQPAGTTAAKTGTATNLTDVWTTATQCDARVGARTTLVWKGFDTPATLPKGTSSADAARVADKIFNGTPDRDTNCSLIP